MAKQQGIGGLFGGGAGRGLRNLLFGGVVLNLLRGQFGSNQQNRPSRPITGRGVGRQPSPPRQPANQGRDPVQLPGIPDLGQTERQRRPQLAAAGPAGPIQPGISAETPQELEQFTFPGGNVLKFTAGSSPALALNAVVDTIAGSALPAADIYGVIGAVPEDPDAFMQALTLRWQEAMAASFGDEEAAKEIFRNGLIVEATPVQEELTLEDIMRERGGDFGEAGAPAELGEQFDPADFLIDPGLLFSSETSGENFF